jgi:isocitrate dehydrogenase (NAD+)
MVKEGRAQYADPSSMIRAGAMMLDHIGYPDLSERLNKALDICTQYEKRVVISGRSNGATGSEFGDYIMETVEDPGLESRWASYIKR